MMRSTFLFAGETSGDLHGSHLIRAMRKKYPNNHFCGVGGPRMRQENFTCWLEMENFQVMGFSDVFKSLPRLWKQFYRVRDLILQNKPDCVILIDYPGFNLRLARALRRRGFQGKMIQLICPTIWAHGKGRIETLASNYDLLLTIYPFEAAYFSHTHLKVEYIGNPLVEAIQTHRYQTDWKEKTGVPHDRDLIALFPGSRLGEIERHVPQQLQAAASLKARHPQFVFALSCAQESIMEELKALAKQGPLKLNEDLFIVPSCYHYELMKDAKAALAKSGTVTLELALHSTPSVVHYELSTLNYLIAKYVLKLNLSHYCIVNILANNTLFPELMGRQLSPSDLHHHLENLIFNTEQRNKILAGCDAIQKLLGGRSSDHYAAQAIEEILQC